MSEIVKLRTRAEIDEEAAIWVWRMESAEKTASDQQAFDAWLRQDSRHRRALEELSQVWESLDGLAEAKRDERIATFTNAANAPVPRARHPWWYAAAEMLALEGIRAGLVHNDS